MTKCHKTGQYLWEQMYGMLVFTRRGRSKIYSAKCSVCQRSYEFKAGEITKAMKEGRA